MLVNSSYQYFSNNGSCPPIIIDVNTYVPTHPSLGVR